MHHRLSIIVTLLCLLVFFSHCSGEASRIYSSETTDSGLPTDTVVGGNISALTISGSTAEISFDDLSAEDSIILMMYTNSSSSSAAAFELSSLNSTSYLRDELELDDDVAVSEEDEDLTGQFSSFLRDEEAKLNPDDLLLEGEAASGVRFLSTGSQKSFKVLNSFSSSSSYDTVTATLVCQTQNFLFYVDNRNTSDITQSDAEEIAATFDSVIDTERDFFGTESDVNGDSKFAVLFTQSVNELGASAGGMVTGFFYAADLFDTSTYAVSNEMEIFYTFVPDPNGNYGSAVSKSFAMTNIYPGVLPHEYQHMISFNQHYNLNGGSIESSWLNEALSHLSEDIYQLNSNDYMTKTGLENPARVEGYLSDVANLCFSCGTSLYQRGGSYLFLRYLYEQAELGNFSNLVDGKDLLNKLLDTDLTGKENVVNAVFGEGASEDEFQTLMGLFGLAVYLSNTDATSDSRFGFKGINLRSTQDDNRGTVLNGPAIQELTAFPFADTLSGSAVNYMQISGQTILNNGGVLEVGVSADADFGGYIIQE